MFFSCSNPLEKAYDKVSLSKDRNIKVRNNRGSTSEDLKDFANPIIKRLPDVLVIHTGTNSIFKESIDI